MPVSARPPVGSAQLIVYFPVRTACPRWLGSAYAAGLCDHTVLATACPGDVVVRFEKCAKAVLSRTTSGLVPNAASDPMRNFAQFLFSKKPGC